MALWQTLLILLLTVVLLEFRYLYSIVTFGMLITAWYVRVGRRAPRWGLIAGIVIVAFSMLIFMGDVFRTSEIVVEVVNYIDNYTEHKATLSDGLSQTLFSLPFPLSIVGRLGYAAVTPLPLWYADFEWTLLGIGTLVQFMFLPFVCLGILTAQKDRTTWPLLVGFVIVFSGYVFGTFAYRHITQIVPFAAILAAFGYSKYKFWRVPIWAMCSLMLLLAGGAYLILKGMI